MKDFKLDLSAAEKQNLKQNKVKISGLRDYAADEIGKLLNSGERRAKQIYALIDFQSIPSIGPEFAMDLISMGYFSVEDLLDKNGHELFDELERKQGFWTDPCVEDQCLLAVNYANNKGSTKSWWDFTAERKAHRIKNRYPATRPVKAWYTVL